MCIILGNKLQQQKKKEMPTDSAELASFLFQICSNSFPPGPQIPRL